MRCQVWGAYYLSEDIQGLGKGAILAVLWLANQSLTWYTASAAFLCSLSFK